MRLVLLKLFILGTLTPCFSQYIFDAELSETLKSFWAKEIPDTVKPTLRKFNFENKQIVFFGTRHKIKDTSDPMYIQIEKEIDNLHPTLILTEGNSVLFDSKVETTRMFGDAGFCAYSGFERGIRVKSWDILYNDLYYLLQKQFSENELYTIMTIFELGRRVDPVDVSFSDFIADIEARGWPFRPEQKSIAFFVKQYKQYFDIPLQITSDKNFQIPELKNSLRLKKYYSIVQPLRDEHLIKTLKENLRLNDRIFIQAGALHLMSLEKIIPSIIKDCISGNDLEKKCYSKLTDSFPAINCSKSFLIERISSSQKKIILFGSSYNDNYEDPQYTAARKEIESVKPDLILTQGIEPVYVSGKQTISQSGVVGFCRLQGISKGIRVNSWQPSWNDVYYALNRKYKSADIYFSLLCWSILENNNIKDVNAIEDLAAKTLTAFVVFGYPLKINSEFDFFNSITEYLGQPLLGTFGTPVPVLGNPDSGNITLNNDGSYKFCGTKPGTYNYKVPLYTNTGARECTMVPLKIIAPASSFVEISGSLPHPVTYMSIEDVKKILQKRIDQNIINDFQLISAAHLLKQVEEYKDQYKRIFIQADLEYINFIKAEMRKIIE